MEGYLGSLHYLVVKLVRIPKFSGPWRSPHHVLECLNPVNYRKEKTEYRRGPKGPSWLHETISWPIPNCVKCATTFFRTFHLFRLRCSHMFRSLTVWSIFLPFFAPEIMSPSPNNGKMAQVLFQLQLLLLLWMSSLIAPFPQTLPVSLQSAAVIQSKILSSRKGFFIAKGTAIQQQQIVTSLTNSWPILLLYVDKSSSSQSLTFPCSV